MHPRIRPLWDKSNGFWYARLDGKKRYLSSIDENSAWKKLLELQGETTDRAKPKTMMKACEDWCTLHASTWERGRAKHFATWCHRRRLKVDAIDNDMFARWVKWCQGKFAPKTVRHNVYVARKILTWCQEHGWIKRIPRSPKLAKPVQRPKDLNDEQINDAWSDLPERAKRIATFILETGCRPGEARKLHWADVDLKRNVCVLSAHKTARTGRPRTIFLTATAQAILEGLPTRTGYVFLSRLGKPYTEQGLKAIIRRRGINLYALRHTRAQRMLDEGVAIEDVAAWLGHADLATVQVYAQVRDDRLRNLAKRLKPMVG